MCVSKIWSAGLPSNHIRSNASSWFNKVLWGGRDIPKYIRKGMKWNEQNLSHYFTIAFRVSLMDSEIVASARLRVWKRRSVLLCANCVCSFSNSFRVDYIDFTDRMTYEWRFMKVNGSSHCGCENLNKFSSQSNTIFCLHSKSSPTKSGVSILTTERGI